MEKAKLKEVFNILKYLNLLNIAGNLFTSCFII